jgi:hypothetical protein
LVEKTCPERGGNILGHSWSMNFGEGETMPRTITIKKLDSVTARQKLKRGRMAHWQSIAPNAHLGWQRWPDKPCGRWLLRRLVDGEYTSTEIGKADDNGRADGRDILDHAQAMAKVRELLSGSRKGKTLRMTVRQAADVFLEYKRTQVQTSAI